MNMIRQQIGNTVNYNLLGLKKKLHPQYSTLLHSFDYILHLVRKNIFIERSSRHRGLQFSLIRFVVLAIDLSYNRCPKVVCVRESAVP